MQFTIGNKIETISGKQKVIEFIVSQSDLQAVLKGVLPTEKQMIADGNLGLHKAVKWPRNSN